MNIGWIGTGVMGRSMAGHLLRAGHQVRVFNRSAAKAQLLVDEGAVWADTPAAAARGGDVVFSMVGYPRDVEEIDLKDDGIFSGLGRGAIAVDFTTSSPSLARRLASVGAERGLSVLDAPVCGGDVGAKNAALSIMIGGDKDAVERGQAAVRAAWARRSSTRGPPGAGSTPRW